MLIKNTSTLTGMEHTLDLDVTIEQLEEYFNSGPKRRLIQHIFPNLTEDEREFIKSGITKEEWDTTFPDEPEDNYEDERNYDEDMQHLRDMADPSCSEPFDDRDPTDL